MTCIGRVYRNAVAHVVSKDDDDLQQRRKAMSVAALLLLSFPTLAYIATVLTWTMIGYLGYVAMGLMASLWLYLALCVFVWKKVRDVDVAITGGLFMLSTICSDFAAVLFHDHARVYPAFIVLLAFMLMLEAPRRVIYTQLFASIVYLTAINVDIMVDYGWRRAFEQSGSLRDGIQAQKESYCACILGGTCARGLVAPLSDLTTALVCLLLTTVFMLSHHAELIKKTRALEVSTRVAGEVAKDLVRYDLDMAEQQLEEAKAELTTELYTHLSGILTNLRAYRPYIQNTCFFDDDDEEDEDDVNADVLVAISDQDHFGSSGHTNSLPNSPGMHANAPSLTLVTHIRGSVQFGDDREAQSCGASDAGELGAEHPIVSDILSNTSSSLAGDDTPVLFAPKKQASATEFIIKQSSLRSTPRNSNQDLASAPASEAPKGGRHATGERSSSEGTTVTTTTVLTMTTSIEGGENLHPIGNSSMTDLPVAPGFPARQRCPSVTSNTTESPASSSSSRVVTSWAESGPQSPNDSLRRPDGTPTSRQRDKDDKRLKPHKDHMKTKVGSLVDVLPSVSPTPPNLISSRRPGSSLHAMKGVKHARHGHFNVTLMCVNFQNTLDMSIGKGQTQEKMDEHRATFEVQFNLTLSKAIQACSAHRGMVDSFVADRLYASFNASRRCAQHGRSAAGAALQLYPLTGSHSLNFALATGKAFCGEAGCEQMRRFNIVGSIVQHLHVIERLGRAVGLPIVANEQCAQDASCFHPLRQVPYRAQLVKRRGFPWDGHDEHIALSVYEVVPAELASTTTTPSEKSVKSERSVPQAPARRAGRGNSQTDGSDARRPSDSPQEWMYELDSLWEWYTTAVRAFLDGSSAEKALRGVPATAPSQHVAQLKTHLTTAEAHNRKQFVMYA
eukprot:TRINITY_DN4104_c0_g1_i1.p1 TRINITY_DN4104_c0_g1~~TRINITY_DN4104_c0_g1_i1.p1  ORF type:complete len:901 (+),score=164.71 TRINITY_DN4104_c0_g1_i1:137-2839(+)